MAGTNDQTREDHAVDVFLKQLAVAEPSDPQYAGAIDFVLESARGCGKDVAKAIADSFVATSISDITDSLRLHERLTADGSAKVEMVLGDAWAKAALRSVGSRLSDRYAVLMHEMMDSGETRVLNITPPAPIGRRKAHLTIVQLNRAIQLLHEQDAERSSKAKLLEQSRREEQSTHGDKRKRVEEPEQELESELEPHAREDKRRRLTAGGTAAMDDDGQSLKRPELAVQACLALVRAELGASETPSTDAQSTAEGIDGPKHSNQQAAMQHHINKGHHRTQEGSGHPGSGSAPSIGALDGRLPGTATNEGATSSVAEPLSEKHFPVCAPASTEAHDINTHTTTVWHPKAATRSSAWGPPVTGYSDQRSFLAWTLDLLPYLVDWGSEQRGLAEVRSYVQSSWTANNLLPERSRDGDMQARLFGEIWSAAEAGHLESTNWAELPLLQVLAQEERRRSEDRRKMEEARSLRGLLSCDKQAQLDVRRA